MPPEDASDDEDEDATSDGLDDATNEHTDDAGHDGDESTSKRGRSRAAADAMADAQADGIEATLSGEGGDVRRPADALQDPADNVPTPEVPSIEPDVPDAPESDEIPEGLRAEFWELVFAANVALFGLSLGTMLLVFDENVPLGALSLVVGALASGFLLYRYRNRQHTP